MANLRIIYNNVADIATITASSTAGGFSVETLKDSQKTSVHRSGNNSVTYTLTWANAQKVSAVALPATNLLDTATIQVNFFTNTGDITPVLSTATFFACKDKIFLSQEPNKAYDYTQFGYSGATKTSVWLANELQVRKVVITLTNSTSIDCAKIVCGTYWESSRQVSNGITVSFDDASEIVTTRSGNTYVDRKPVFDSMTFDLVYLSEQDRIQLMSIMRGIGSSGLIYVCIFPDNNNPETTQSYSIYGRSASNSIQYQLYNLYNSSLSIKGW